MQKVLALFVFAIAVALAGCGGGSGGGRGTTANSAAAPAIQTTTTTADGTPASTATNDADAPTHGTFVDSLNRICKGFNAKAQPLQDDANRANSSGDYDGLADVYQRRVDIATEGLDELHDLQAPAADAAAFDDYNAAIQQQEGAVKRIITALRSQDQDALETLSDVLKKAQQRKIEAAIALGADDCGQA